LTVRAGDPAHPGHVGQGRLVSPDPSGPDGGSEADDALAVWARARDALRRVFADEEAVARTADVLPAGGSVPDGRCLRAARALDHVLVALPGDVDGGLAHAARDHGRATADGVVRGRGKLVDRADKNAAIL
jgi:hypothetical protein